MTTMTLEHRSRLQQAGPVNVSTVALLLMVIFFRFSLDFAYAFYVSPLYDYAGFGFQLNPIKLLESYALTVFLTVLLPGRLERPSDFLLVFFVVTTFIPVLSLYALRDESRLFLYALLLGAMAVFLGRLFPRVRLPSLRGGQVAALVVGVVAVALISAWLVFSGAVSYFNLSFDRVYELRPQVQKVIEEGPFAYLNTWVFKFFNLLLISWAIWRRRYVLLLPLLGLQVFFFGVSAHKAVLLFPVLILFLYTASRLGNPIILLVVSLGIGIWGAIGFYEASGEIRPFSLLVRRTFFVPANLDFGYLSCFSRTGFVYFSTSLFSGLLEYPFDLSTARVASRCVYGHTETWANNGLLASGFMHAGYLGIVLYGLIAGFFLRVVDSVVGERLPVWLTVAVIIVPFNALFRSSDLTTAFGTHGLAVGLFFLWLFSESKRGGHSSSPSARVTNTNPLPTT